MKKPTLLLALALWTTAPAFAAGLMSPKDGGTPLQIKDHSVRVVINNGFAVTEVDQTFHNPHDKDLEAIYTFPLPKDASLSELSLWIDGQEVVGEVLEKKEARRVYEEERAAGRDTAVAEKREYYAFDVSVSPVRAGSDTRVRLVYLQPLEIDTGVGRYVYPLEEGMVDAEAHEFWNRDPQVHGRFAFECLIRTAYPLENVRVKGYDDLTKVTQSAPDTWMVNIEGTEGSASLNQDIVVYYMLRQDLPARVDLLAHREDGDGTFLLVVTPGADLEPITEGVDWSVVLDVSGSMDTKIAGAAEAVARAVEQMRPEDRFRVVVFSDRAQFLTEGWVPATSGAIDEARRRLLALASNGGTNLYAGLQLGLQDLSDDRTSAVLLVSDGGANVGPTEHAAFLKLLDRRDVRVFTFVIGQGANLPLMERLARESGGFAMELSNQDDLYGRILQAKGKLGREAMHGVRLELEGVPVADLAPARLPSAYHGQQIALLGRYRKAGEATLRLRALISGEEKIWETRVLLPEEQTIYPELERIWALARVEDLMERIEDGGPREELRRAVVDLGTAYSIVTDFTSMVVVSDERFDQLGVERNNRTRVETERGARQVRIGQYAQGTRADQSQPMFDNRPAGSFGGGAAGPEVVGLLAALLGARRLLRRKPPEA